MYLIKAALIIVLGIFVLHLIPVGFVGAIVAVSYYLDILPLAQLAWLVFYVIDFPLIWFASSIPVIETLHEQFLSSIISDYGQHYYWNTVIVPGCCVQIIGWANWCIILGLPLLITRMWLKLGT